MKNIIFFAFILLTLSSHSYAQSWDTVGSRGFSSEVAGAYNNWIAIDGSGMPYVVYSDYAIGGYATVMKYNGSDWVNVGIPGFSSGDVSSPSIAIDGSGTPYVVYGVPGEGDSSYAYYNNKATVMKFDGSDWVTVGSARFSDTMTDFTSIAIDGSGTPYVAYEDYGNSKKATVMKFDGSSWVPVGSPGFSAGIVGYIAIAIDGSGTPYVVYTDYGNGDKATVMKYNGSSWVSVGSAGFSAGLAGGTCIVIDTGGTPYVAYADGSDSGKAVVMKYNGSDWVTVGSPGLSTAYIGSLAIAINRSGTPYVVYPDGSDSNKATVKSYNGASWATVGNAGFSIGRTDGVSIAINGSGTPYVVYQDNGDYGRATVMKYGFPNAVQNINNPAVALTVFPDPNEGVFTLHISSATAKEATITVTNILGEKIKELTLPIAIGTNSDTEIKLDVPSGIYILSAITSYIKLSKEITILP